MPTPRNLNKHFCSCGLAFANYSQISSHFQRYPNHKQVEKQIDIVMDDGDYELESATGMYNYTCLLCCHYID